VLVDGAIQGMVEALDDPYSGYMSPEIFQSENEELSGEIQGIGVVIHTDEETGEIVVIDVIEGAPAQVEGVMNGDIIIAVDGEPVLDMGDVGPAGNIRGPEGTDVTITVRRDVEELDFTITRARIEVPNIEAEIVGDNIAYIRLYTFSANAREQLDAAIETLDVNSRNGLIFDLRDNGGGYLSSAIDIGSAFIKSGTIVTEWFSESDQRELEANGTYADIRVPITVLVNEWSASASELIAGAMQDLNIATIIGETTLGKGTVQTWYPLSNSGGVRITIARWLTPNGNWIHEAGVQPDITIEWTPESYDEAEDPQLDAAIEFLTETEPALDSAA
jgi:carboxyl-terminal processing protease